jgi:transposase InsO family protein
MPHPVPEIPWEEIGIDFFKIKNTEHLLVIDYHSKFVEVKKMTSTNADAVTACLLQIFRSHGLPKKIHSDNGPPFDSHKFATFCSNYLIEHMTSSPYYPKSNGMVERAIQTLKSMLVKTLDTKGDPNLAIIDYNNTPKVGLKAPAQMLMGRLLKTVIPVPKETLKPIFPTSESVISLRENQEKQKKYYNKSARPLRDLNENENVYMQRGKRDWVQGKVIQKHPMPKSYIVKNENGTYRRNRIHLRPTEIKTTNERNSIVNSENRNSAQDRVRPSRCSKQPTRFKDYAV